MAEALKREFDLFVLKARMKLGSGEACVQFDLEGRIEGVFQSLECWVIKADELGIPAELKRSVTTGQTTWFRIPDDFVAAIKVLLDRSAPPGVPLWLHFTHPVGFLAAMPWERLLNPRIERPILRLPDFLDHPGPEPSGRVTLALCGSAPAAKDCFPVLASLDAIASAASAVLADRVEIHIFTDVQYSGVTMDHFNGRDNIIVHDPEEAADYLVPEASSKLSESFGRLDNPWLHWMRNSLGDRPVDFVHFLCHGYMNRRGAALALAESPLRNLDQRWARFVGATQVHSLVSQLGAWGVGLSSPPQNFSGMGLRQLAADIAERRPGPVIYHELSEDMGGDDLKHAFAMIFGSEYPRVAPTLTMSCHPSFVSKGEQLRGLFKFDPVPASKTAISESSAWKASGSRYLETQEREMAQLILESKSRSDTASSEQRLNVIEGMGATLDKMRSILSENDDIPGLDEMRGLNHE